MKTGFSVQEKYCQQIPGASEIHDPVPQSKIEIISYEQLAETGEDRLVFDLTNAPASHANALRRTLLASVPSIAIELVGMLDNTGVMPDEVLCHRLGLIPINADPSLLDYPKQKIEDKSSDPNEVLLFGLHVIGGRGPTPDLSNVDASMEENLPPTYIDGSIENPGEILSSHLVWMPYEGQREKFGNVAPLHADIPITKILPGQTIHLYCRAIKGIGSDHAKFQPVCTAFYRLVPSIQVKDEINSSEKKQQKLISKCPMGVFDIEDSKLVVRSPRKCTTCRECIRNPSLAHYVSLGKEANHYEFTVESVGVRPAYVLVKEALQILQNRCDEFTEVITDYLKP
ncbi:RNA polymerase Rpb3/Rpb11 dimerization domain containing protein [Trichomonas vaginalis G3]|uniref:RNA polymerase Rpb3/Rpb11 dimerisation domain containing protein n=1 Tax=Trichomonas vaginalis (strain ATCC PRA-98 / G3) TaxID=412133 RepID=A2ER03_TRIV3|nr:transcription by RNA polymerase I [Trichomonas vaginalis G3]EAY04893.1 RNA polymerase Rpb3/Rpb11 dimerization domain containing protein [Trichomonas vaginalis G3]KAI5519449.1 transcription by RNA polymerase I [Trichomonas vaginalis G3]|eukprot:XP_001317116.1 RNA polymerase Rpb3/Rpb11 dimerisation domain containing protein [Trichomonas vaginalis G3]